MSEAGQQKADGRSNSVNSVGTNALGDVGSLSGANSE